ncbi:MAG: competence/damage-inducible protein A [Pseudarcicella sp.]|nr:competence/damage-inducible protein A [Pseudarcicella sp.]MBP6409805.1 competence/damage-inducible protein A [Pseudarcicella sp.]
MTKAEIITIGDEILYGQITDTNTQWISAELDKIGIKTIRKSSVGDNEQAILEILSESKKRADIIFITGGLGPTKDDITKKTLCHFFDTKLATHPLALSDLQAFFQKRNKELTPLNLAQSELPEKADFIPNKVGTAAGMWFSEDNVIYISMPGVPFEMKAMMSETILPKLQKHFELPIIFHRNIRTAGIGESYLADLISDWEDSLPNHLKLAYLPSIGQLKLRLTGFGEDLETIKNDVNAKISEVLPLIEKYVFGYDNDEMETVVAKLLIQKNATISVAESCTGGYLAHQFTKNAGSSAYFKGGIVAYHNDVKTELLNINSADLEKNGAVSEETVSEMAKNIRLKMNSTFGLATSGIAGPTGGTPEKPVGTIWIALATEKECFAQKIALNGSREQNIHVTTLVLLNQLRKNLLK